MIIKTANGLTSPRVASYQPAHSTVQGPLLDAVTSDSTRPGRSHGVCTECGRGTECAECSRESNSIVSRGEPSSAAEAGHTA
eukprot:2220338-Rhodomonas_salina.3